MCVAARVCVSVSVCVLICSLGQFSLVLSTASQFLSIAFILSALASFTGRTKMGLCVKTVADYTHVQSVGFGHLRHLVLVIAMSFVIAF